MSKTQSSEARLSGTPNSEAAAFLDLVKSNPPLDTQTAPQNRVDLQQALPLTGVPTPIARVENGEIAGVPVRIYSNSDDSDQPCVVYLHGGGWVIGDTELADTTTRDICLHSGATVVSVEYRLAPEHPFPAAFEDALAVTRTILAGESGLSVSRHAVAIAGDSAGGNLAAGVSQQLRGQSPALVHQVLIYPTTYFARVQASPSYSEYGEGFFLSARDMEYFYDMYGSGQHEDDLRLHPGKCEDLAGLPRATVITAECDPLRDDGEAYARALDAAGNEVTCVRFNGQVHPFVYMGGIMNDARAARRFIGGELRATFQEVLNARSE